MKNYNRIMAGSKSIYADVCFEQGFIGVDYDVDFSVAEFLNSDLRSFNESFKPKFHSMFPDRSKIAVGLACAFIWTVAAGLKDGDIILTPDGRGNYRVGEITGSYSYVSGAVLPHRRKVHWLDVLIKRSEMSQGLQRSTNSTGTCCNVTKYADEIEGFIGGKAAPKIISTDETVEDPSVFALEKHLEDFLVQNWSQTELGRSYDILTEDGELVGQQYPSDTGPIDILAVSKDQKELLVVELKKGRASDAVVGQIQRYMGYCMDELAEEGQKVRGIIIALEEDQRLYRALRVTQNIQFYRYHVRFDLIKNESFA